MSEPSDSVRDVVTQNLDDPGETTATARAFAIVECDFCDDDGYRGTRVCDHRQHSTPQGRAAAMATVRKALEKGLDRA